MRRVLQLASVLLVIAALHTAWVFYSRGKTSRQQQERQMQQRSEDARKVLNSYGGERLLILHYSITPGVIDRGQQATLCYGVSNAKTVKIEPEPSEELWPSMSRCVQVTARRDTQFKLTAQDAAGHIETAVAWLKVR